MSDKITPQHYSYWAIILHWLLAFALAFQMGMGWQMEALKSGQRLFYVAQLHKSIGITILILSIARLVLRFYKKTPPPLSDEKWAHIISKTTHIALYGFMIGAPLTGWLMVSSSRLDIDTYLFGTLYWPHIPGFDNLSLASQSAVNSISQDMHYYLAWMGILLFLMHVAGALRHQFLKGEPLLERILPVKKLSGNFMGSASIIVIASILFATFIAVQFIDFSKTDLAAPALATEISTADPSATNRDSAKNIDSADDGAVADIEEDEEIISSADISKDIESDADEKIPAQNEADESTADKKMTTDIIEEPGIPYKWSVTGQKLLAFSLQWNGDTVTGGFSDWKADILFASNALDRSTIAVNVNLSSVTTSDATASGAIMGADFFNVASFPTARFTSNKITALGGKRYQAAGDLRLKNIQRPLNIIFTLDETGRTARAKGSAMINRLQHDIGDDSSEIANEVRLSFDFMANR